MSDIKQRFSELARAERITLAQLQERIGVSNAYVANISKGIGRGVALNLLREFPKLNMDWLEFGSGEMYIKNIYKPTDYVTLISKNNPIEIGKGSDSFDYKNCIASPISNAEVAFTVYGDSMSPEYPNGCVIYIKKLTNTSIISYGSTYLIETEDGYLLRKLLPADGNCYQCVSADEARYPRFEIEKGDIHNIYNVLACLSIK